MSSEEMSSNMDVVEQVAKKRRTVSYNRCRKPFDSNDNCSTKALRNISQEVVNKFNLRYNCEPKLTTQDKVCIKCRKKMYTVIVSSDESSESNSI